MISFSECRIFVGSSTRPDVGQWFELPITKAQVEKALRQEHILDDDSTTYISDYEAPFKIKPNDNIDRLSAIVASAQRAMALGHKDKVLIDLLDSGVIEANEMIDATVSQLFMVQGETDARFAEAVIDEMGGLESLGTEELAQYFDYNKYAHDLLQGDFVHLETSGYYVEMK
ncbi:antirestriction protein ArdA [Leuconostoc citreum]